MATTSDDPPADAIPLSEALVAYVDSGLVEARRVARERFRAAYGFSPDSIQHSLTDQVQNAVRDQYYRAGAAITDAFRERARTGQLRVWAREGSPVAPLRLLPADAWRYVRIGSNDILIVRVPGREPIRYFGAVVAPVATTPVVASVVASTLAAETRCRAWLVELMLEEPTLRGLKASTSATPKSDLPSASEASTGRGLWPSPKPRTPIGGGQAQDLRAIRNTDSNRK